MKKHASTIVLVALAVGLGAYVAIDHGRTTTSETEARKHQLVSVWRPDDVTRVELEVGGERATLVRDAGDATGTRTWTIDLGRGPSPADQPVVDQLLRSLEDATATRRVEGTSVDRKAFGLDAPRARLRVAMGKIDVAIALGAELAKPQRGAYAEVDGKVAVIAPELASLVGAPPSAYRDKALVPIEMDAIVKLDLEQGSDALHLRRVTAWGGRYGGFALDDGHRARAGAVDKLALALAELKAEAFLAERDADAALTRTLAITIEGKTPKDVVRLELGGPCPGKDDRVIAVRRAPTPLAACVAKGVVEKLAAPRASYDDRGVFGAAADEISELDVRAGDDHVDLARRGSAWHERAPHDREVSSEQAKSVLEALTSAEGELVARDEMAELLRDPAKSGLDKPAAVLRVVSPVEGAGDAGTSERVEQVRVFDTRSGFFAMRSEDNALLRLAPDIAKGLVVRELALRPRRVVEVELAAVKSVAIDRRGTVQRFTREGDGNFRVTEPAIKGLGADNGLATNFAFELGKLTAEAFVADRAAPEHGLDKPRLVATLELEGKKIVVEIGAPTKGGAFARVTGDPSVFVAPETFVELADRWMLDRAALLFDAGPIERVVLRPRSGKKLVVEQRDGAFRSVGEPDPDGTRAAATREGVTDLIAESVASVGKPEKAEGLDAPVLELEITKRGEKEAVALVIGAADTQRGVLVRYVRRRGVDATFAIAQSKLKPLFEAAGVEP